ncbi:DUF6491 family protein [Aurantiacibacter marinus]|uniref:Uncharacterized protein n=1 Tax=Aurantiacibacter marinus TaxID=874156 RepID=A0A0H0XLT4_9SPHN|nr:DUF6491 family protein [Aurantiacibacter marinus]KLI62966.1 hypothetical protein AAV99_13050 [Aurantiacibacter marinus]
MTQAFYTPAKRPFNAMLGAAIMLGLAGCAPVERSGSDASDQVLAQLDTSRSCFNQREIRGYARAPGGTGTRERIYLDTGLNERFLLETVGACPDLDFSLRIRLDTRTIGSVCTDDLATLVIPPTAVQEFGQCPVRVLGRVPKD